MGYFESRLLKRLLRYSRYSRKMKYAAAMRRITTRISREDGKVLVPGTCRAIPPTIEEYMRAGEPLVRSSEQIKRSGMAACVPDRVWPVFTDNSRLS
jgi:hypothetical protein